MNKLLTLLLVLFLGGGMFAQTDLELSIKQNVTTADIQFPLQFNDQTYLIELTNKSNTTATNVSVQLDYLDEGDDKDFAFTSSQTNNGSYDLAGKVWTVGTVPANGSVLLSIDLFHFRGGFNRIFGQVTQASQSDSDSTPGNNNSGVPAEDDEAIYGVDVSGASQPDYFIENLNVVTQDLQAGEDFIFNFDFVNAGSIYTGSQPFRVESTYALSPTPNYDPNTSVWFGRIYNPKEFVGTASINRTIPLNDRIPDGTYYFVVLADDDLEVAESDENNNLVVGPQIRVRNSELPELTGELNQPNIPTGGVVAGATLINVFLTFDNNADVNVNTFFTTKIYLSTDSNLSPDDVLITELSDLQYFTSYRPGLPIPFNTIPGDYFFIVHTDANNDVAESNETNNFSSSSIKILTNNGVQPQADLEIEFTATFPTYDLCCPNRDFVNYRISNIGNNSASNALYGMYLSTDQVFDSGDTEVELVSRSPFFGNPGFEVNRGRRFIELDPSTPPGNYFLLAVADINSEVSESNENNNVAVMPLEVVQDQLPELSIVGAEGELVVEQGGILNVTVTVQNEGATASEPTDLSLWRVPEVQRDPGEVISQIDIPSIPPNSQLTIDAAFPIRGNQRIRNNYPSNLFIDFNREVSEIDETNNLFGWRISVIEATDQKPDFRITTQNVSPNPYSIGSGRIFWRGLIYNDGTAEINNQDILLQYYLSSDNQLSNDDVLVADFTDTPAVFGPGDVRQNEVDLNIPANTPRGEYFLIAVVDANDSYDEFNEANNTFLTRLIIDSDVGSSDLVVQSVDCPDAFPNPNQDLTYNFTVRNNGTATSEATTIYLYHRGFFASAKRLYGSAQIPPVAPNALLNLSITVPSTTYFPEGDNIGVGEKWIFSGMNTGVSGLNYFSFSADGTSVDFSEINYPNLNGGCKKFNGDLQIDLEAVSPTIVNNTLSFKMTVTNNGPETAYNVISSLIEGFASSGFPIPSFTATLSKGEQYRQDYSGGGTQPYRTIWYIPTLTSGESAEATVTITDAALSLVQDAAEITRNVSSPNQLDNNTNNNTATISIPRDNGGEGVDLEISGTIDNADPNPFAFVTATFTIRNTGDETATGIIVPLRYGDATGIVPKGGDEGTVSQGTFSFGTWNVGSLAPGATATIEANYFMLSDVPNWVYAEVFAVDQVDIDSEPNNGQRPDVNEDDEAVVFINGDVDPCENDNVPPVFQGCVGDIVVETSGDGVPVTWLLDPFAIDNCTPENEIEIIGDFQSGFFFPLGTTVVTFTATDDANNIATCSFTVTVVEENTGDNPTVVLTTPSSTVDGAFTVTATFSESVTDFTLAEIQVSNGTKSNAAQQSGSQYNFTVTPTNTGEVTIFVPANAAFDNENNGNLASEVLSVTFGSNDILDYAITAFSQPAEVIARQDFDMNATVENVGTIVPPNNAVLGFYLSTDQQFSSNDILLATAPFTPLGVGQSRSVTRADDAAEPGDYFVLYVLGNIADQNQSNNFAASPIKVLPNNNEGVDLELTGTTSNNNPTPYDFFSVSYTISNKGDATATGITVNIPEQVDGAVPKGGDEFEVTKGSYNPFEVVGWRVGGLSPGESATITLNYFNLSESPKTYYAEVSGQSPSDIDSSPRNGTPPTPNEDDEAVVFVNGDVDPCDPDNSAPTFTSCVGNINTLTSNNEPVAITWLLNPVATDACTNDDDLVVSSNFQSGDIFPVGTTEVIFSATDLDGNIGTCSFTVTVTNDGGGQLPDLNLANLGALPASAKQGEVVDYEFDLINSGTAQASGDYIISAILSTDANVGNGDDVEVGIVNTGNTPIGTISDVQGSITLPNNLAQGAYFFILVADANNAITETNESNNFLSGNITVEEGDGGEGVDLSLIAAASNLNPSQWSFFSVELVVSNQGSETASGIQIQIPEAEGVKLKGGDEYDATQGSFIPYGDRKWNVGSLAAGQSATIVLNYFNTTTNSVTIFGQVTDLDQTDTDSSPNNNNTTTPQEDDEAAVTVNAASANTRIGSFSESEIKLEKQVLDFQILKIYPSLTANDTRIVLNSKKETTFQLMVYNLSGQQVSQQDVHVIKGINEIDVEASQFESGMYHILLQAEEGGRPLTTRFIKQKH